eukprot:TRINITY_DN8836_c0_g1_i1.p1 TRINITY_DN8836_c0_g1~~TRINITY_DN8836_c0_g1_i1.p1  ORF type:complete len:553 (-),score=68.46 TRINITY_DN8836_c0_g1_i1:197-1855(-)
MTTNDVDNDALNSNKTGHRPPSPEMSNSSSGSLSPSTFDVMSMANDPSYLTTTNDYMSKRKLWKGATAIHIWALGVGAVISGEFFGFNLGYSFGGLGTFIISLAVITVMYVGIALILSELSSTLPFAGGAYAFSRATLGKFAGCLSGTIESIEYLTTVGSILWFLSDTLCFILGISPNLVPLGSVVLYAIVVSIHCWGGILMWSLLVLLSSVSVVWLLVFFFGTIKAWDGGSNLDVIPGDSESRWFSDGAAGFFAGLAPSVWFYLAVEEVPLAAEECKHPKKDVPRGLLAAMVTLIVLAWMSMFAVAFTKPGVATAISAGLPLSAGFDQIFGGDVDDRWLAFCSIIPIFTSGYSITFAYGRQIFAMSRAGYFPSILSLTTPGRGTPGVALIIGAIATIVTQLVLHYGVKLSPADILFSASVITALVQYAISGIAFIILRVKYADDIPRPFIAPLGIPFAVYVILAAVTALVCSFIFIPTFKYGVVIAGGGVVIILLYYLVWSRNRLRVSPEEQFAMFCVYRTQVARDTHKMGLKPDQEVKQGPLWTFLNLFS